MKRNYILNCLIETKFSIAAKIVIVFTNAADIRMYIFSKQIWLFAVY